MNKLKVQLSILDSLSLIFSFVIAYLFRNYGPPRLFLNPIQPIETYLRVLPLAIIVLLLTFSAFSLYSKSTRKRSFDELLISLKAQAFWILLIMSFSYLSKYDYSRILVILTFFFNLIFLNLNRLLFRKYERKNFEKGLGLTNIIIVGAGRPGRSLARVLIGLNEVGYHVVGFVDDHARSRKNFQIIGKLRKLKSLIKKYSVKEVYFTDPRMSYEEILTITSGFVGKNISFKVSNNLFNLVHRENEVLDIDSIPTLDLWRSDKGKLYLISKRALDIVLSVGALIISIPFWMVIASSIYLEDGRPIILRLDRVGINGKTFKIYKFRSMIKSTNSQSNAPRSRKDNRITRIGAVLRKFSLDELPQLLNILQGDMSLVGPRPEMPHIVSKYSDWQRLRLTVKPGLTGLWQVLGRKDLPLHENIEYDFYYINNQSILLDLTILIKTIPVVLTGRGAY